MTYLFTPDAFGGKVAVISGAGSVSEGIGNGRAAALLLARAGAAVVAADISASAAEETAEMIEKEGGPALAVQVDACDLEQAAELAARAVERFGRIDILVNNVGVPGARGDAVSSDPEVWDCTMRLNAKSVMAMSGACIPDMRTRHSGSIVNLSSTAGLVGGSPSLVYSASKGAVVSMTRAMAGQHAGDGIRVNCVAPGMVLTPRVTSRGLTAEMREQRRLSSPLRTEGTAWDVGNAVLFLASDAARWITGAVLPVDAGFTAVNPGFTVPARTNGGR